jgi:hypothetical protein
MQSPESQHCQGEHANKEEVARRDKRKEGLIYLCWLYFAMRKWLWRWISPWVGLSSPTRSLSSVLLPAPLGPTRTIRESRSIPKSRPVYKQSLACKKIVQGKTKYLVLSGVGKPNRLKGQHRRGQTIAGREHQRHLVLVLHLLDEASVLHLIQDLDTVKILRSIVETF